MPAVSMTVVPAGPPPRRAGPPRRSARRRSARRRRGSAAPRSRRSPGRPRARAWACRRPAARPARDRQQRRRSSVAVRFSMRGSVAPDRNRPKSYTRAGMIGSTLSHYHVLELLGAGGMGEVYRASDTKLGRDVAAQGPEARRCRRPGAAVPARAGSASAGVAQSPSVATLFGFESAGDVHFLVMELVAGETLAQRIGRARLSLEEALPSSARSRKRWRRHTRAASCIGTSSPPTSRSRRKAGSRCSTSVWPGSSGVKAPPGRPSRRPSPGSRRASSRALPPT